MVRTIRLSAGRTPIEFELDTFEFVRASASTALVRVCGRWRAEGSRLLPAPLLTVVSLGQRHRLQPVAGTPAPRTALDAAPWAGGFAAPMGLVKSGEAWTIEIGTELIFALPALHERVTGIRPLPPQVPAPTPAPGSAGDRKPSDLALARRATTRERARADELHEQLQASSARADRLAVELGHTRAQLKRDALEARQAGQETHAELARVSAAHDTALARNREVEGLLVVAQLSERRRDLRSEPGVGAESERVEGLEREADEARRAGRQAQAELARVSAAHDAALARNREIEGLLLLADRRARQLQVGWELEVQDRLVVARRVAATREAQRRREAAERRLAERQTAARRSAQRIKALDQALTEALVEERRLVEAFEPKADPTESTKPAEKAEQTDRAGEKAPAEPDRRSGGDPVRAREAAPQHA